MKEYEAEFILFTIRMVYIIGFMFLISILLYFTSIIIFKIIGLYQELLEYKQNKRKFMKWKEKQENKKEEYIIPLFPDLDTDEITATVIEMFMEKNEEVREAFEKKDYTKLKEIIRYYFE